MLSVDSFGFFIAGKNSFGRRIQSLKSTFNFTTAPILISMPNPLVFVLSWAIFFLTGGTPNVSMDPAKDEKKFIPFGRDVTDDAHPDA